MVIDLWEIILNIMHIISLNLSLANRYMYNDIQIISLLSVEANVCKFLKQIFVNVILIQNSTTALL